MKKNKILASVFLSLSVILSSAGCAGRGSEASDKNEQTSASPAAASFSDSSSESASEPSVKASDTGVSAGEKSGKEASTAEASKPEASKPETSKPETSKPETSKPETSKPETSKPETSKPEASKPETSKPEASKPEASKPEASKPEASKPEASKPEASKPEASKPETEKPKGKSWIKLQDSSVNITLGSTYKLNYTTNETCVFDWFWSDSKVINMTSDGTITTVGLGTATVSAKTDSGQTVECSVTVTAPPPPPPKPVYKDQPVLTGEQVSPSWFDDAVFVGDSVTNKLNFYADNGCLGDAEFLCSVGIGYHSAMWGIDYKYNVHPVYNGKKVLLEDGLKMIGRKKIFIMLGMNDIGGYGVNDSVEAMKTLTDRILRKIPDAQLYIQSVTPLISSIHRKDLLNNDNIALFNEKVEKVCKERGFVYIDVAEAVSDRQGNLIDEYCADSSYMGLHFNNKGCKLWVEYLRAHVK